MKKTMGLALCGILIFNAGCKGKNDVLATYTGGKITRGEFYDWIDAKHFVKDTILKSKKNQKSKLEMMALDRFAVAEAKKIGFDNSDEFKVIADMATDAQLMDILYTREIKDKTKFKEPAVRIRHILLKVKDFKIENNKRQKLSEAEMKREADAAIALGREIIAKLDKGAKFEELAKQYSADFSKKNGGDIGYIISDMMPPEYSRVAFSLKDGAYTRDPLLTPNGVYIIRVVDRDDLTEDNLDKIIKDKMQATRLKNRFYSKASKDYLQKLINAPDVESHMDKVLSRIKSDVIFKVGTTVFTVGDLDKRIGIYMGRLSHNAAAPAVTNDQKKALAENFFKLELLKRDAMVKGIDKDPEYVKIVGLKKDSILAREYMKKIGAVTVAPTETEMREEYEQNKDKRYYTMLDKGGTKVKVIEPYAKMRERIKKILENKKQSESIKKWREEMLKSANFRIDESELEGE